MLNRIVTKNTKQADLRSQSLDLLRFPLAVAVLAVHVVSPQTFFVKGELIDIASMPAVEFLVIFISAFIKAQSVPIYYFISGYVFFYGVEFTLAVYKNKLKNRFRSLFIPYIVWNILALSWILFKMMPCFTSLAPGLNSVVPEFSLKAFLFSFWDNSQCVVPMAATNQMYPINPPLWFVRDLFIVVLTTPLVFWIVKKMRAWSVYSMLVLWFASELTCWGYITQLITAYTFFICGAYMSIYKKDMMYEFGRCSTFSFVAYPLLSIEYMICAYVRPEFCTVIKLINILVGLLFAYNVAALLIERSICKPNKFLSSAAFFIYVSHFLIYNEVLKILFLILSPVLPIGFVFLYLLAVLVSVILLLVAYYLMNRYAPMVLRVIAGKRG